MCPKILMCAIISYSYSYFYYRLIIDNLCTVSKET